MMVWQCPACGHVYDEAEGDPDAGIPPGAKWEDIPVGWVCPDCGTSKAAFEFVEI